MRNVNEITSLDKSYANLSKMFLDVIIQNMFRLLGFFFISGYFFYILSINFFYISCNIYCVVMKLRIFCW